jgi:hypothetical protein
MSAALASKRIEPCDTELSQIQWTAAIVKAVQESARLNKIAAFWTAIAVLLAAASSGLGILDSLHK